MHIGIFIRLLLGYVRIEVEGYYIERFINICTNKKILIWNLKREKNVKLYLNIGISDFKRLSEVARKTKCKIRIKKKRGIPFLLNKYRKRKLFVILLLIISLLIYISSNYVWNIDINVKDNLTIDNLQEELEKVGLKRGVKKDSIDTSSIINKLKLDRSDISWVGIDIEGTNVIINVVKADNPPEIINNNDYCNIVAGKDGLITKIVARNGTARVNVDDQVKQGDVLIEGIIEGKYTEPRQVHSLGEVKAKVKYSKTKRIELNQKIKKNTGKEEKKYEINFNNYSLSLYTKKSNFNMYTSEKNEEKLKIGKNFYLPISITKITNKEEYREEKVYSFEEAKNIAVEEISSELEKEIENKENIVNKIVNTKEGVGDIEVEVIFEVIEDIGVDKK